MKTRDKIVHAALQLFNENGERNITTNHIAADLGISPGNLYYHFHNKQEIIYEIFESYSMELLDHFTPVEPEQESLVQLKHYLDSIFTLMWKYRFFYANLAQILQQDRVLHEKYLAVQEISQLNLQSIFKTFIDLQLFALKEEEIQPIITNLHLIIFSWLSYQSSMHLQSEVTEQVIQQGMLQMTAVIKLFTTDLGKEQILLLEEGIRTLNKGSEN
ncbi:MAG: AcrR family transcriptional regulator [Psychromonas sp.]|jgi:AcrR family transcriptional regulator|uniref:TetR/AcrR family transcriptional regulator n=1 Tax=Psychromonas sp. TaxID=1884585 RepID=UPI0039E5F8D7